MCQTQPASVRSSAAGRRRDLLADVVAARVAPAVVRGARQRPQPSRRAGAAVVDAGRGDVPDRARRRPSGGAATPPRRRRRRSDSSKPPDALDRRPPERRGSRPTRTSASVSSAPRSSVGHRQRLAAAGAQARALEAAARIGPPSTSWSGYAAAPASIASSQPGHTSTSSSRKQSRSPSAPPRSRCCARR